jgi:hypothetical protein
MDASFFLSLAQTRLYWILNCTWYCPVSVGLFEWHAYLVKLIENWWCPFNLITPFLMKETEYRSTKALAIYSYIK